MKNFLNVICTEKKKQTNKFIVTKLNKISVFIYDTWLFFTEFLPMGLEMKPNLIAH